MKVSGTYTIPYNEDMSILNLENIYVHINVEDEEAEITLPKINLMNQRNVKFYINLDQDFEQNFSAKIYPADGDTINGNTEIEILPGDRGFWVLVQDSNLWTMASSQFIPASMVGMNVVIRGNFTQGYEAVVFGGVEPYSYNWSLASDTMDGFGISTDPDLSTVELVLRPDDVGPVLTKSGFVPDQAQDIAFVSVGMLRITVQDSLGQIAKEYLYLSVPTYN
jgi:hypothetical protein